ncbi:uncharacterized protein LOC108153952 [Drosophila miranda]|uniref:uncharacterized protein LOC108153952 n=1 Tax=Drosophila miranda TaxID=7229 RepID=UPI00143F18E0|nr:uncharacterized protein LOC108153952 [Drosophila miranda]
MFGNIKIVLLLLLSQALTQEAEHHHLAFLANLIESIHKEEPIQTLLMLQHHQDKDCSIQDLHPEGIPILRANEFAKFNVMKNYNQMEALGLVCLGIHSNVMVLLNALAMAFSHMRHVRIILWMQGNPTEDFLKQISDQTEEHNFLQMLVLGYHISGEVTIHRLNAFPSARFEKIEHISSIKAPIFHQRELNFQGKKVIVLPKRALPVNITTKYAPTGSFPITRIEDRQIIEFALRYNLTLVLTEKQDFDVTDPYSDIQFNPRPVLSNDLVGQIECVNTFSLSSLMVVVPCGRVTSITDVFHKLDLRTWFLYILSVYATFVVAETVILVATHRISGRSYRLTNLNPCVNMRAFRAILGLPFPIGPKLTVSLRMLFLAMILFGMIFSNFFSCKLSSLLTKHPLQPQVDSFEQLQKSGLTVIGDRSVQPFIESEVDEEFIRQYLPKLEYRDAMERVLLMMSANDSLAFIVFIEFWRVFDTSQQSTGRKTLCESKHLSIMQNLPRMPEFVPLSLKNFKWLFWILGCGYGLATLVFLVEVYMGNRKRKVESKVPVPSGDQEIATV